MHSVGVVRAEQQREVDQLRSAQRELPLNVVHHEDLHVALRVEQPTVHVASAEEERVAVLRHRAVDQAGALELRALRLRFRRRDAAGWRPSP